VRAVITTPSRLEVPGCPQRSGETVEYLQGWLEAPLLSHRWIRREIATSRH